jgi:hypothetical protein
MSYVDIECAHGDWFPGLNYGCQHDTYFKAVFAIIAIGAITVATAGLASGAAVSARP